MKQLDLYEQLPASRRDAIDRRSGGRWRQWKGLEPDEEPIENELLTNPGACSLSWTGEEVR